MRNIVVIGGGTGTFTVLSGLKKYVAGDNLKRSLICHDSQKLAKVIVSLL